MVGVINDITCLCFYFNLCTFYREYIILGSEEGEKVLNEKTGTLRLMVIVIDNEVSQRMFFSEWEAL